MSTAVLLLATGEEYKGRSFGAMPPTISDLPGTYGAPKASGEVVFNTAMSGYHEVLTDPSYAGQIVVLTYPHAGNYGCDAQWSETGPEGNTGRSIVKPAGMVVRDLYDGPVPAGRTALNEFLLEGETPGITGIDTRALTLQLRDGGSRNGAILAPENGSALTQKERSAALDYLRSFPAMEGRELVSEVGGRTTSSISENGKPRLALFDCGIKANIIRELERLGAAIVIVPSSASEEEVESINPDALFVSNGPGDPAVLRQQVRLIQASVGRRPVLGICLGHQLIAEAIGARTYKMKFGHHGVNHPVRDELTGKVFVTSQNHGFAVDEESLPDGCRVWFRNANDRSIEGILDEKRRIRTTQFHPESAPGPHDALWIFESFLSEVS